MFLKAKNINFEYVAGKKFSMKCRLIWTKAKHFPLWARGVVEIPTELSDVQFAWLDKIKITR